MILKLQSVLQLREKVDMRNGVYYTSEPKHQLLEARDDVDSVDERGTSVWNWRPLEPPLNGTQVPLPSMTGIRRVLEN